MSSPSAFPSAIKPLKDAPGPRHGLLLRLALWEGVPGEGDDLEPVGALVAPAVQLLAGNVEVAGHLGAVTQRRLLCGQKQTVKRQPGGRGQTGAVKTT